MKEKKKSLSQQTADRIYEMITKEQRYRPGDQIPNELLLSEELGISRTTLRDAVRMLTLQGVLEVRRGKGTFVTSENAVVGNYGIDSLERVRVKLKDLFEMRLIFEPQAAALACRRGTDEEINAIIEKGDEIALLIKEGKDRTIADQEFHHLIGVAAHNEFMNHLLPLINNAVSEAISVGYNREALASNTLRDHAIIMEFLQKRDARGAKNAMEIHIHHAIYTLDLNNDKEPIL